VPALERIDGSTFLLRGSPQALLYLEGDTRVLYVVDPGQGGGRVKALARAVRELAPERVVAVVTHFHSDHLEVLSRGRPSFDEVLVPRGDEAGAADPRARLAMTFGYPLEPGDYELFSLPFPAPRVEYTGVYEPGQRVGPLETLPLPGHTPGHAGVATPDGVLYAGDAIFGTRVLERYALPYHRDPCTALESLDSIAGYSPNVLVPGHGPPVKGQEALELVNLNKARIAGMLESVEAAIGEGPATVGEVLAAAAGGVDASTPPGLAMLLEQTVRGALACLARRGRAKPVATARGLGWVRA